MLRITTRCPRPEVPTRSGATDSHVHNELGHPTAWQRGAHAGRPNTSLEAKVPTAGHRDAVQLPPMPRSLCQRTRHRRRTPPQRAYSGSAKAALEEGWSDRMRALLSVRDGYLALDPICPVTRGFRARVAPRATSCSKRNSPRLSRDYCKVTNWALSARAAMPTVPTGRPLRQARRRQDGPVCRNCCGRANGASAARRVTGKLAVTVVPVPGEDSI